MQLNWQPSPVASGFHAAVALLEDRPLVDADLAAALRPAVSALSSEFDSSAVDRATFCEHLVPQSAAAMGSTELARVVLTKTIGSARAESLAPKFAGPLREIARVYATARPQLDAELPQRAGPISQQWRARGPGLLKEVQRLTDAALLVERADVMFVDPVLGGAGRAHVLYNSVRIEAVLSNPDERLPEVVRLAWLLAQLNLELPMHSERIHRDRLRWLGPLAMLPVVLTAAEHVELARCDQTAIDAAVDAWRCTALSDVPVAESLLKWWQTYMAKRPSWAVALAALDAMF